MLTQRRRYSATFKAKVALEALKGQRTVNEISAHYGIHPNLVTNWKKQVLEGLPQIFAERRSQLQAAEEDLKAQLYQQIGQLKVELDWVKKKSGLSS